MDAVTIPTDLAETAQVNGATKAGLVMFTHSLRAELMDEPVYIHKILGSTEFAREMSVKRSESNR